MCLCKNTEPIDALKPFSPNVTCLARGQIGAGNIHIDGHKRPRYKCHQCGKTFSTRAGGVSSALAVGLTDHIWSVRELLMYKVVPRLCRPMIL